MPSLPHVKQYEPPTPNTTTNTYDNSDVKSSIYTETETKRVNDDADDVEEQQEKKTIEELEAREESQIHNTNENDTSASQSLILLKDAVKNLRSRAVALDNTEKLSDEDMVSLNITLSGLNDNLEKACRAMNGRYNKDLNSCQLNITDRMLDIVKSVISKKPKSKKVEKKQIEFAKYAPLLMFGDTTFRKLPTTTVMRKLFSRPLAFDTSQSLPYIRQQPGSTCGCNSSSLNDHTYRPLPYNRQNDSTCGCNSSVLNDHTCPPSCPYACNRMNSVYTSPPHLASISYRQPYEQFDLPWNQQYTRPRSYNEVQPSPSFAYPFVGGKRAYKSKKNKTRQRGGGTQRATYSTQGVCHNCGSLQTPQHHGQASQMPTSCPPSFYPAVPPVPMYQQQSGGGVHQSYVLDAQGELGHANSSHQGGQQFVVPTRVSTLCNTSVFPANGIQTSANNHKSLQVSSDIKKGGGRGKRDRVTSQKSRRARK